MIAHRGVSGLERENTCPAFLGAASRSYYGIETDVHMTKDGKLILIHDDDLNRVTNGACKINVEESNFADVENVIIPDLDGSTVRRDIRVPLLAEYIAICKKYGKKAVLEIKGDFSEEGIDAIIEEVKALDYLDGMIFITFGLGNCIFLRKKLPSACIQFLATGVPERDKMEHREINEVLKKYSLDFDVYYKSLTPDWAKELHDMGVKINCWTCDDPKEAERLINMGVDYITTNILE